jgi:hypothetical protein
MSFQQLQGVLFHNCVFVVSLTTAKLIIPEINQFRSTHLPLEIKCFLFINSYLLNPNLHWNKIADIGLVF